MRPDDTTARIPLCARDGTVRAYTLVDAADAARVGAHRWSLDAGGYARRTARIKGKTVTYLLHRFLLGLPPGDPRQGDHINHVRLDNRQANLRVVTKQGNRQHLSKWSTPTSSRHRGVSWEKRRQRWLAVVVTDGKRYQIGRFKDEAEAAEAVRLARQRLMPYALD